LTFVNFKDRNKRANQNALFIAAVIHFFRQRSGSEWWRERSQSKVAFWLPRL